jgi:hypothetical protein
MSATCWAKAISGCSAVQSREHYISKSLFDGSLIRIQGFRWCKDEEVEIGIGAAASKILCKTHNERLSDLDMAAGYSFACFRKIMTLENTRKTMAPRLWSVQRHQINGRLLERWFLKTLINLVCVQDATLTWIGGLERTKPPTPLVEQCFGLRPINPPHGMHAAVGAGQSIDFRDYVKFAPITKAGTVEIAGGMFEFHGLRFVMSLVDQDLEPFVNGVSDQADAFAEWQGSRFLFPLKCVNFTIGSRLSQELKVKWPPFVLPTDNC